MKSYIATKHIPSRVHACSSFIPRIISTQIFPNMDHWLHTCRLFPICLSFFESMLSILSDVFLQMLHGHLYLPFSLSLLGCIVANWFFFQKYALHVILALAKQRSAFPISKKLFNLTISPKKCGLLLNNLDKNWHRSMDINKHIFYGKIW